VTAHRPGDIILLVIDDDAMMRTLMPAELDARVRVTRSQPNRLGHS
jgi:hypothetical protein